MYELFIEGRRADIDQKISILLSYAVDDINQFGSRNTSFSKTIVLPGTANNNIIFGHTQELGSFNDYAPGAANVDVNFNVAQTSKAEIRYNGLLMVKGVFRLTGIVKDNKFIEYEGSIFGELAGFAAAIGNSKLEDLDFSEYNHEYTINNITSSWNGYTREFIMSFYVSTITGKNTIAYYGTNDINRLLESNTIDITNSNSNDGTFTIENVTYEDGYNLITVTESVTLELLSLASITLTILGGYYYPLIDYGNVSATISNKVDYKYIAFRPSLFVKDYIDKIFFNSGYSYESDFFNSQLFKSLIIPLNKQKFERLESQLLNIYLPTQSQHLNLINLSDRQTYLNYTNNYINGFTELSNAQYQYTGTSEIVNYSFTFNGYYNNESPFPTQPYVYVEIYTQSANYYKRWEYRPNRIGTDAGSGWPIWDFTNKPIDITHSENITLNNNDVLITRVYTFRAGFVCNTSTLIVNAIKPVLIPVQLGDTIVVNEQVPKNIMQKDFFTWIMKMFNLYVDEDKLEEKKLIIKPYVDYYDISQYNDWTYKLARDKPLNITPMGMLNGRFIECKYKTDNDFYNESYQKKFNLSYGDRLFDTGFQFSKDSQKIEIGFSPTVLLQYDGTDKAVSAILKKSGGVGTTSEKEDAMDSNIRILYAKKITGVDAWDILDDDGTTVLENNLTEYGYAGHLDDPLDPTFDLNFGVPNEIYFEPNTLTTNNLFNTYWSGYIAEIADKDSKLLKCNVYLTHLDIAQLDFSIPVFIDGVTWRINKVEDYDATNNELVKVELLKIINNG